MEHTKEDFEAFTPDKAFDIIVESNVALTKKIDRLRVINADLLEALKDAHILLLQTSMPEQKPHFIGKIEQAIAKAEDK